MGFPDLPLGERMHAFGVVLRGRLEAERWVEFLHQVARAIGMNAVGEPAIWHYPLADGAGGVGKTMVLPITESFLALDTWPDHRGAYLFVCSCRDFDEPAIDVVAERFGLASGRASDASFYHVLRLT